MTAFLFLWDPARWSWPADVREQLGVPGSVAAAWSTGARRTGFASGDRAFLFKVNHRERGIVASGRIIGEDPEDPAAERSRRRTFVDIVWDCLLDLDDVLTRTELRAIAP